MTRIQISSALFLAVCGALLVGWTPASCFAQPGPRLQSVTPRGLQVGQTTEVTVRGSQLGPSASLLFPFPAEIERTDDGQQGNLATFHVNVPAETPAGYYALRVRSAAGISAPQYVAVGGVPNTSAKEESVLQLPAAITGDIQGDNISHTKFVGQAGESITVEVEAQRLGSKLRPVIELLRPDGNILAVAHGVPQWQGDCRLRVELPVDGTYTVRVHDVLYRGGRPGFYRLKMGEFAYADAVTPFAVTAGDGPASHSPAGGTLNVANLQSSAENTPGIFPVSLPPAAEGRAPQLFVRDEPLVAEADAANQEALLAIPHGVNGTLSEPGESDTFGFVVQPGQKIRLETLAERAASLLDSVLQVKASDGRVLANADDFGKTRDSRVDVTVPGGVAELQVTVTDRMKRGGAEFAYCLLATLADQPDFSLSIEASELSVPQGGQTVMLVSAARSGYDGPIELMFEPPLPAGFSVSGNVIPAGATQTLLTVSYSGTSPAQPFVELIGRATIADRDVHRFARRAGNNVTAYSPWLARDLVLATVEPRPLKIAWDLSPALEPAPGDVVNATVQLPRQQGTAGNVRLQLLTSQVVPLFESGPNQGKPQQEKAIRLTEPVTVPADANTADVSVTFPNNMPFGIYDLALVAELLSADGKNVLERVMTPAHRLTVIGPAFEIALEDASGQARTAVIGEGEADVLRGRVKRIGGLAGPVSLMLGGLPEGWVTPEIQVPAGVEEFRFPLNLPFSKVAGAKESIPVTLTGSAMSGAREALPQNVVALKINVTGGDVHSLLPLFEDERNFAARLTEGGGQVTVNEDDRYSGLMSLQVTPDQRFRTQLPGLDVAIKEHPGPGEYRYLRFAWKKPAGKNVMLQLHANGNWGPLLADEGPAFRYQAGASRPDVKALQVSEELPGEWVVVTRDLFADFGEFQLDGIALTPGDDGEAAYFDHIYLAKEEDDFAQCPPASDSATKSSDQE